MQRHTVYFFEEDDQSWLDPIADFVKNGVGQNETVIVIVTEQNRLESYEVNAMVQAGAFEVIHKERAIDDLYGAIQRAIAAPQRDVSANDTTPGAENTPSASQTIA